MSATPRPTILFEQQADPQTNRMCGAAALSMVYRSFDKAIAQPEVWPKIAKLNRLGSLAAYTHLMAQDALNRGFAALVMQAKHPLQALRLCLDNGFRAILNHRLKEDVPTGHFTVLVDIDGDHVVLHDPYFGPSRRLAHAELLELWRPRYQLAEIAGNMLIAIAAQPAAVPPCQLCGSVIPPSVNCPKCGKPVPLQPAALLGCVSAACSLRMWDYISCASCDFTWNIALEAPPAPSAPDADLWNLANLFGELDKFTDHVMSLPEAASHPDLLKQVDGLKANKDKLKLAQSEELVRRKVQKAQITRLEQRFRQEEEAIIKKREEIKKPAPPLDGNALGQALVKELGLEETLPEEAAVPPPPAAQPAPPRPAAPARKPESQQEPAPGEYEAPNWDTLDVRE